MTHGRKTWTTKKGDQMRNRGETWKEWEYNRKKSQEKGKETESLVANRVGKTAMTNSWKEEQEKC